MKVIDKAYGEQSQQTEEQKYKEKYIKMKLKFKALRQVSFPFPG